ncbi:MAG: MarC family protein [Pseudomonadales bacterium]
MLGRVAAGFGSSCRFNAQITLSYTGLKVPLGEWSLALVLAWSGTTLLLVSSPFLMRFLGNRGSRALERLMGMILVILATQLLMNGIEDFVRAL